MTAKARALMPEAELELVQGWERGWELDRAPPQSVLTVDLQICRAGCSASCR